jgi:hypothetical protein
MFDLKVLQSTLEQIEKEKNIPREKILEAIEHSLAAAYKKDYGAKGQIIRSHFNPETGDLEFFQVKTVVDETTVKPALTQAQLDDPDFTEDETDETDERVRFNIQHHMYLPDAQRIKAQVQLTDEIIFPLDNPLEECYLSSGFVEHLCIFLICSAFVLIGGLGGGAAFSPEIISKAGWA